MKHLVDFTETPLSPSGIGDTPIHYAAMGGHLDTVRYLVGLNETPITPGCKGDTPIHKAVEFGHLEIVTFLAPLTNTPLTPNDEGQTPIHDAARNGHLDILKYLVEFTDTPNALLNNLGQSPIQVAKRMRRSSPTKRKEVTKFLEKYYNSPLAKHKRIF